MKNILTIFRRELGAYFNSAIAYIFIIVFALLSSSLFMAQFFLIRQASMRPFFSSLIIILCVFIPAVSMRLWSEDKKGNTIELLLTFPMRMHELVLGKFLASAVFFLAALAATAPIPVMVVALGNPDPGTILCGYLGAFLVGSFYLALGILVSGFCRDQIVAFVLSMMASFAFFLLGTDPTVYSLDGWVPGLGTFLGQVLGLSQRYDSFVRGVIDLGYLAYFVAGAALFLFLNGFWLEGKLRPRAKTAFATAAGTSAVIFLVFNFLVGDFALPRLDLTQGQIYTISSGTKEILQNLDAPALVKLYISPADKMPAGMKTLERDVKDKLDEFRTVSKGNFRYKVFHLEAADVLKEEGPGGLEETLLEKGIRPIQVRSIAEDEVGVSLVYSSIAISYRDKPEEVIPGVVPGALYNLEYTLISKIHKMSLEKTPHAALVARYDEFETGDPLLEARGGPLDPASDPYRILHLALESEGYKVSRIKLTEGEPIPEDATVLVVVEPEGLSERQRFEINRFVVNGGSVFLAVQNNEFRYQHAPQGGLSVSAEKKYPQVNQLLKAWGLEVDEAFLLDEKHEIIDAVSDNRLFGVFQVSTPAKVPVQIRIDPDGMNQETSVTSNLPFMLYMWGTALNIDQAKLDSAKLNVTELLHSTRQSWKVPFQSGLLTREAAAQPPLSELKSYPLAVLVEGEFPDAFEGRGAPAWPSEQAVKEGEEAREAKTNISRRPGKLLLIGCASIFGQQFVSAGGHLTFFVNAVDSLTLGEALVKIRSKRQDERFIGRISAAARFLWRLFTTFLIPVVVILAGAVRLYGRGRAKANYLKMLKEA